MGLGHVTQAQPVRCTLPGNSAKKQTQQMTNVVVGGGNYSSHFQVRGAPYVAVAWAAATEAMASGGQKLWHKFSLDYFCGMVWLYSGCTPALLLPVILWASTYPFYKVCLLNSEWFPVLKPLLSLPFSSLLHLLSPHSP